MPLRVSSNWSSDLLNMKMAQHGQHIKTKKPSHPELYEDAARILEELLTRQLEDPRPRPLQWRHRSDPLASQRVHTQGPTGSELEELKGQRSNTLPLRTRLLVDQDVKERDVRTLERKASTVDTGSASSADTEGDSSFVSEKRRKKTVFRKARDRLLHAFHRQAREKNAVQKDGEKDSKSPTKEKSLKTVSPKRKQNDKSTGQSVRVENSYGSQLPQTDLDKSRNSGKSLMDSIRKSLRLSKKKEKVCPTEGSSVDGSSKTATSQGSPDSLTPHSLQPAAQSQADRDQTEGLHAVSLTPAGHTDQGLAVSPARNSPSPFPQSTSTDSYHDSGNKSSSLHSIASTHGAVSIVTRNALDNPEEDILYMDDEARTRSRHGSGAQLGGDKRSSVIFFQIRPPVVTVDSGYSNNGPGSPPPLPQEGSVTSYWKPGVHNKDGKALDALMHVDSLEEDGDTKDGADVDDAAGYTPFNQRTQEEKEELYSKIAKKLSLIADRYTAESGPSDSETRHRTRQQEDDGLTDLEKEIIACLRDKGDKLSQKVDEPAERMIEQTKAQTYEQFKRTIQHSLGSEVSWNHLAFLFYTTRGVVSAVGRSSDVAVEVTEMTLKYFSDKFASWIIDQGGFESVLTESEPEVD